MNIKRLDLLNLINTNAVVVGESYRITDYSSAVYPTVIGLSPNEVSKNADDDKYTIIYDVQTNIISFLSDGNISANCDWTVYEINGTNIVIGTIPGDADDFKIKGCSNVVIGDDNYIQITSCDNIIIGDKNRAAVNQSTFVTIGNDNEVFIEGCNGVYVGNNNHDIHMGSVDDVEVNDNNSEIDISAGTNIIGSGNVGVVISSYNNVVKNGCRGVELTAGNNFIDKASYVAVGGEYNTIMDSDSITIENGYGNELRSSQIIRIADTNNNDIFSQDMTLSGKTAFQKYRPNEFGGVIKVNENIIDPNNRQSDNNGTILYIEGNTLDVETKGKNKYELKDGIWQTIN